MPPSPWSTAWHLRPATRSRPRRACSCGTATIGFGSTPTPATRTFRADATFCAVDGSVAGSVALASYNYPNRRIRHRDFALWLDTYQDTAAFRADSSFRPRRTRGHPGRPGARCSRVCSPTRTSPLRRPLLPLPDHRRLRGLERHPVQGVLLHGPGPLDGPRRHPRPRSGRRPGPTTRAWAPTIAAKNGKYYFYFCGGAATGNTPTTRRRGLRLAHRPVQATRSASR